MKYYFYITLLQKLVSLNQDIQMVDLDEQIKKDRQHNKSHKPNKKQSRGNDRQRGTSKGTRGSLTDKRRGIRKDDRKRESAPRKFRNDRQSKGPRRIVRGNRDDENVQRSGDRRIGRDPRNKNKISRAPRNPSPQNIAQNAQQKARTLKVMGLHPDFTNQDLYKLFSTQGALQKCLIEQDNFGRSMTTAIVKYYNGSSAKTAIANLNQHKVMNSILTVQPYKNIRR